MPKRLNKKEVRSLFEKYGYTLPKNFVYRNVSTPLDVYDEQSQAFRRVSVNQLRYKISRGRSEYLPDEVKDLMNLPLSTDEKIKKDSFERFVEKRDYFLKHESNNFKREVFKLTNKLTKNLMKQQNFTIENNTTVDEFLSALMYAIETAAPKIDKDIRLTVTDEDGKEQYLHANKNTVDFLRAALNGDRVIGDTNDVIVEHLLYVKTVHFEFKDFQNGKRINPGFFPYLNVSDIDLKRFGIFNDTNDPSINESCLIQAFIASKVLTDEELKLVKSFVQTRTVPRSELRKISELLKIRIEIKIYYPLTNKTSFKVFGESYDRTIKLIIIEDHYMLNDKVDVSECYIKNYRKINLDPRFKNHDRKMMLLKFDDKRYSFSKKKLSIRSLVYLMIENKLLVPMNQKTINKLHWSYKRSADNNFNSYRKIYVPDKKPLIVKRINQTKAFFGYVPEESEIQTRLMELQNVIDSLKLRNKIDVSRYYKFSELMQKIMFEYGCFDGVYSFSGKIADKIRSELNFPKIEWSNIHLKQKLYYIDQAGAYMSSVRSIPSGLPDANGNFKTENTKIKDLIEKLYDARMSAKLNGKDKLATTLKFMMNSCWGFSIQKPKVIKHKFVKNVDKYVEEFAPYVLKYSYNDDKISGFVDTVNPYVESFTYPQFAKSVLREFNDKMNYIKNIVKVYYSKVDSALISENDFKLLCDKGLIGNELGKFKIEHVFAEIYFKSAENWIGKHEDGSYYFHCSPKIKKHCEKSADSIKCLMQTREF